MESLKEIGEVVLDPNKFSEDGTSALGYYSFSEDGDLLAFQVSEGDLTGSKLELWIWKAVLS